MLCLQNFFAADGGRTSLSYGVLTRFGPLYKAHHCGLVNVPTPPGGNAIRTFDLLTPHWFEYGNHIDFDNNSQHQFCQSG